jgi:hypothetical protein
MNWDEIASNKISQIPAALLNEGSVPQWPKADMPNDCSFEDYSIMSLSSLYKNEKW